MPKITTLEGAAAELARIREDVDRAREALDGLYQQRKAAARAARDAGMPAKEVAALLGHVRSATPQITTVRLKSGELRYEFTYDTGRHPVTGRRRQTTIRSKTRREAKAELARVGHEVHTGTFTPRWDGTVGELLDDWLRSACFEKAEATKAGYVG